MTKDEKISQQIFNEIKNIVDYTMRRGKGGTNSQSNPFESAYLKDKTTGKVYKATINNGEVETVECISDVKPGDTPELPEEVLEGLIPGRLLIWHDEFDGDSVDTDKWKIEHGYARNGEIHNRVDEAISVENSCLTITATKLDEPETIGNRTFTWHAGELSSKNNFDSDFYMEFKYKLIPDTIDSSITSRKGFCPAIWMMGDTINGINWPICGEEDMMESPSYNAIASTCHYAGVDGTHVAGGVGGSVSNIDWSNFHTHAIEREGNTLRYIFDGKTYAEKDFTDTTGFYNGIIPFTKYALQVIINIAVGGTASSSATEEERGSNPASMVIDWVRVYAGKDITVNKNPTSMELNSVYKGIDKCTISGNTITINKGDMVQLYPEWDNKPYITKYKTSSSNSSVADTYNATFSSKSDNSLYIGATDVGTADITITETVSNLSKTIRVNVIESDLVGTENTIDELDLYDAKYWRFGEISTSGTVTESFINHAIHTVPIKVESGKTYSIRKTAKIIPIKTSEIVLGTTKYTDILSEDGVKTLNDKDEWTAPSDCNYVILVCKNVDANLRARHFSRCMFLFANGLSFTKLQDTISCTGITIDTSSLLFETLDSKTLIATVSPSDCNETIQWTTSESSIATVKNGIVTPKSNGNCIITVTCGDKSATCEVTVSNVEKDDSIIAEWNGERNIPETISVGNMVVEQNDIYGNILAFRGTGNNVISFLNDTEDNELLRSIEVSFWLDGVSNAGSTPMFITTLATTNTLSSINTLSSVGLQADITKNTVNGVCFSYGNNSISKSAVFDQLHTFKLYSDGTAYLDDEIFDEKSGKKSNYYWGNKITVRKDICITNIKYMYEQQIKMEE